MVESAFFATPIYKDQVTLSRDEPPPRSTMRERAHRLHHGPSLAAAVALTGMVWIPIHEVQETAPVAVIREAETDRSIVSPSAFMDDLLNDRLVNVKPRHGRVLVFRRVITPRRPVLQVLPREAD